MRGPAEAVAVARDVASSSPSKPAPALDMMRFQRPSSDCLPLPNGIAAGGSGTSSSGSRKPPAAPAPRSSKDEAAAQAVAADSSRLAAFLASTSLDPKPRARTPQPLPPAQAAAASSSAAAATRSPARDQGSNHHHNLSDISDPASPSAAPIVASGGGSSSSELLLNWGQNKRSRGRRDGASSSGAGSSPLRGRQPGGAAKIQRRSPSPADKLMPPPSGPSYTRGSNLRSASPLPPRSGAGIGTSSDAHHSRGGALPHHSRSAAEERATGGKSAAGKRQAAEKASAGLGPVMGLGVPDAKAQQQQGGSGSGSQQQGSSSTKPAPKLELPRIYTTLSRKEKEEDFLAMKGTKLPQRPKRRPKNVEKAVNFVCPGTWLSDVTRSRYEVREKCPKKQQKNRGLKGMESMDSDSD
ncbi:unnamed protein product [Urochloa humidicola]